MPHAAPPLKTRASRLLQLHLVHARVRGHERGGAALGGLPGGWVGWTTVGCAGGAEPRDAAPQRGCIGLPPSCRCRRRCPAADPSPPSRPTPPHHSTPARRTAARATPAWPRPQAAPLAPPALAPRPRPLARPPAAPRSARPAARPSAPPRPPLGRPLVRWLVSGGRLPCRSAVQACFACWWASEARPRKLDRPRQCSPSRPPPCSPASAHPQPRRSAPSARPARPRLALPRAPRPSAALARPPPPRPSAPPRRRPSGSRVSLGGRCPASCPACLCCCIGGLRQPDPAGAGMSPTPAARLPTHPPRSACVWRH